MTKLLVTERDQVLRDTLANFLTREGYQISIAGDGPSAMRMAREQEPDLILLDLSPNTTTSEQLCQCLESQSATAVVLMTAERADPAADDDHDAGPFASGDLAAQLRDVLRHGEPYPRVLKSGDLVLDLLSRRAILDGQTLSLTPKEFHLLAEFVQHRGVLLSRAQLFELVWGVNYAGDRRTLDVHISWLRKKIERIPERPQRITTVRNLGYRFEN